MTEQLKSQFILYGLELVVGMILTMENNSYIEITTHKTLFLPLRIGNWPALHINRTISMSTNTDDSRAEFAGGSRMTQR